MKKHNSTKQALLMSALALLLCVSMLVGSTFAWFTDSVTNGVNKIASGNLDVELYYFDLSNDMEQVKVDHNTKLFRNADGGEILWEPGASTEGWFTVMNEGTLALKYELRLTFANATATPAGKTLADVLTAYAWNSVGHTGEDNVMEDPWLQQLHTEFNSSFIPGCENQPLKDMTLEGYLLPGEGFTYNIGIMWEPTANDNDYNVQGGLSVDLGVTLVATQQTYENDSYGNQYDAGATFDENSGIFNMTEDRTESLTIGAGSATVINGNGYEIIADQYGLESKGDIIVNNLDMNAGSSADYCLIHKGGTAVLNNVNLDSKGGGVGVTGGAKVEFEGDVAVNTASTSGRYNFYVDGEGSELTINGGTFSFSKTLNQKRAYIYAGAGATVYVKGGTFGAASARSGYTAGILGDGTVIITGGTFGFNPSAWVADGYEAVKTGNTWTVSAIA